ncbi:uncharacterized protein A1O9_06335 [Exophiala aquamarina CBS 119918]|uniref:Uncharacterized protein n=1 Tax=Exophiala aquamarina CBS 119918 TaxID=1182545 RepID=A0A072PE93_9EURO|nr:uncharacterized protein A1O9_06335 [Exophiala aquamarina CBS 119918]KEF58409.1 hypothetical protein A1O9_06335 [Exophiala aquamarina CBS 119918]
MAAGTLKPSLLLSICAFGSVQMLLKEHGFTHAWADHAGKLALLAAETPHEENLVTFATLSLFWYTQGFWRRSYIYKG